MSEQHDHHGHSHQHSVDPAQVSQRSFVIGITLNIAFVLVEIGAGLLNGSMALLTDAGHNASDVASLLLSLLAFRLAQKKPTRTHTYGYKKTTVLAALMNAVLLLIAIGVLGYESINRLLHPAAVNGSTIAWVAGMGILVSSVSALLFYRHRRHDINIKGAYLHLLADALVSVGVVVGGLLISLTGKYWIDPVLGLAVMIVILVSTWSLLRDSFHLAVDAVPAAISLEEIVAVMRRVDQVTDVDHVHVWPLSTTENALTAHISVADNLPFEEKLAVIRQVKYELQHHNIHHSTLELETGKQDDSCSKKTGTHQQKPG
ncbi:cation diffusion facilitator family transporter [Flavisolibacter nicotianae]|uniref:cation diffusion facilitator family transporter n=1 Tax=Flavisolibacter nicotianae TaxID=2364882 RepID=UPI000EAE8B55|nr:cation diffusion facilitator family transporter [Flavisolibacter nicotianae]